MSARSGTFFTRLGAGLERFVGLPLLVVLLLATVPFVAHAWFDAKNDASMYLVAANALRSGAGYTFLGEPFTIRPPGFSFFLAPFLDVFGLSFRALNLMEHAFGILALALLYLLVRPRLGGPLAVLACLVVWFAPGVRTLCNQVFSDVPGTACVFGCLLLERWSRSRAGLRGELVLGLAIGISALVRTVSVFLVPAVIGARLCEHVVRERAWPPRAFYVRSALVGVVPLLVLAPWFARNARVDVPAPAEQTHIHSYATAMLHQDVGDPASPRITWAEFRERVAVRAREVFTSLGIRVRKPGRQARASELATGALLVLCLALSFVRRRDAPELYALIVLPVLLSYFAFKPRLVLPLFALAVPALADTTVWIAARFASEARARVVAAAVLVVFAALDWQPRPNWQETRRQHESLAEICAYLEREVPTDVPIAAPQGWHFSALLGRDVFSIQPAMMREGRAGALRVFSERGVGVYVFNPPKPAHQNFWAVLRQDYRVRRVVGDWAVVHVTPWKRELREDG